MMDQAENEKGSSEPDNPFVPILVSSIGNRYWLKEKRFQLLVLLRC